MQPLTLRPSCASVPLGTILRRAQDERGATAPRLAAEASLRVEIPGPHVFHQAARAPKRHGQREHWDHSPWAVPSFCGETRMPEACGSPAGASEKAVLGALWVKTGSALSK